MVVNKRKKNSRQRGSRSHGWGVMKHKGAGNRGGRGMAGTGKRADCKMPSIWKEDYFGKFGFKKKGVKKINVINLSYLEQKADDLLADNKISKEKESYVIDASKLGFNKVLGCAKLTKRLKITAQSFSKGAVEKIKAAGGEVIELKKKVKEEAGPEKKE